MRILIVKLSSLGDIIHTFPAVADVARVLPQAKIDWLVDERFVEAVQLQSTIECIMPVALKRWRKTLGRLSTWQEIWRTIKTIRRQRYDAVIDAQGLIKSAIMAGWITRGPSHGFDKAAIRESFARHFYRYTHRINPTAHVGLRIRQLFAQSLRYDFNSFPRDYNLSLTQEILPFLGNKQPYVVIAHATTWPNKFYPPNYWRALIQIIAKHNKFIYLPWGNHEEKLKAEYLAQASKNTHVLSERLSLQKLSQLLSHAQAVVTVDTGIGHLAGALGVPTIGLYGPSSAKLAGPAGEKTVNLQADFPCSPCLKRYCTYHGPSQEQPACYDTLVPERIWQALQEML